MREALGVFGLRDGGRGTGDGGLGAHLGQEVRVRTFLAWLTKHIEFADVIGAVGVGLLSYGAGLIFAPLFFIVPGACLTALAVYMAAANVK